MLGPGPGSIEKPSDEITKQPTATPDEVTRIEGQEKGSHSLSVLSDPPRSGPIRLAAPDETWTSTRAPTWFCPWLARERPGHHDSRPDKDQESWPASPAGAEHTTAHPHRQRVKRPSSHAARDNLTTLHPPAVPTRRRGRKKETASAHPVLCGLAQKLIIGRPSARQRAAAFLCIDYMIYEPSPRPSPCPSQRTTKRKLATDRPKTELQPIPTSRFAFYWPGPAY